METVRPCDCCEEMVPESEALGRDFEWLCSGCYFSELDDVWRVTQEHIDNFARVISIVQQGPGEALSYLRKKGLAKPKPMQTLAFFRRCDEFLSVHKRPYRINTETGKIEGCVLPSFDGPDWGEV